MREYIPPGPEFDENGAWIPQGDPIEIPIGLKRPATMNERLKDLVFQEVSRQAQLQGLESLEEANDFNIPDPDGSQLPISQHELKDTEEEVPVEEFVRQRRAELLVEKAKAAQQKEKEDAEGRSKVEGHVNRRSTGRTEYALRAAPGRTSGSDRRGKEESSDAEHRDNADSD